MNYQGLELVPWEREHRAFILDSFRACLLDTPPWSPSVVSEHVAQLDRHMRYPGTDVRVQVARVAKAPDDLVGWVARKAGNTLLFAYVRGVARSRGVGTWMVRTAFGDWTRAYLAYWTATATKLAPKFALVYDPSAMFTNGRIDE